MNQPIMGNYGGQPVLILPEGTLRSSGKDAQRQNITAAKAVGEAVKTTLGPKGMDKMLVNSIGDIIITNDGVTILEEMDIEHPSAKMMVEVAKTQNQEVGDGTTTSVIIAGELLKKAEELLDNEVHPTIITKGFSIAKTEAIKHLESISEPVSLKDIETLEKIAITSMSGKSVEMISPLLAKIVVESVSKVAENKNGKIFIDNENIKREKKSGASIEDTKLISGIVIDKEVVHPAMPKKVSNGKIALIDVALEVKETETDAEIRITSPNQMQAFIDQEQKMLKSMTDKIVKSGANVLICQKGIDDLAQHYLAKEGIYSIRRAKKSDMEALSKATSARIVTNLDDLSQKDLGSADNVEENKIGGESMTFIEGCKDPKSITILVRGSTDHYVDEIDRSIEDAIGAVSSAVSDGKIVYGAGSPECSVSVHLKKFSQKLTGREQLAVKAFADAMEIIPRSLAENAGLDPIDTLVKIRADHEAGKVNSGIGIIDGGTINAQEKGIVEPLKVKTQAIKSASDAAEMILRIDDVISASKSGPQPGMGMPPGGPPME